jgi:hypothetical protein
MKINADAVRNLLNELSDDLKKANNKSYEYIDLLLSRMSAAACDDELISIFVEIKSSAKIIDYANFNSVQEKIWNEIWAEVSETLSRR